MNLGDFNLYMMNADGSDLQQLTKLSGQELHAKWHPDGDKLIFERHQDRSKGLHILNLGTGEITKVRLLDLD